MRFPRAHLRSTCCRRLLPVEEDSISRRDTGGNVAIWLMNGAQPVQTSGVGMAPNTWSVAETGDYNGDGKSDILWRDTSGNVATWFMNGLQITQSAGVGNVPIAWSIQGVNAD
jgi:hypothetical protein